MFTAIAGIILRNRVLILISLVTITIFMGYNARELRLSYEPASLLGENDTSMIEFAKYKEVFGEDGNIVVIGVQNHDFFNLRYIGDWFRLVESLEEVKGVQNAVSLVNVFQLVKNTGTKSFDLLPVAEEIPQSQEDADHLSRVAGSLPFYRDLLYDESSGTYMILVNLDKEVLLTKDRIRLINDIETLAGEYGNLHGLDVHYSGMPYIRTKTADKIEGELYMFIFLALAITGIILLLFFRSVRVVIISLTVVATGVIWALGTMTLLGFEITLLTAMIPPLLIVIGIPNSIFLLNKYHNEYRNHGNKIKALQRVIQKIGAVTLLTNLTTSAGFATFMLTSTRILQEFGLIASVNIMGIYLLSLLLIPVIFSMMPAPQERHVRHLENSVVKKAVRSFEYLAVNHRRKIYFSAILIILIALAGITKITSTGYVVDDLPKNDPVYTDLKYFERHFNGLIPLEISVDALRPRAAVSQVTLQKIDKLQMALEKYPELSKPVSVAEAFKFARQSFFNGAEQHYRLPGNAERNFILSYMGDLSGNNEISSSFLDPESRITRVSYKVADVGTDKIELIHKQIRQEIDSIFPADRYNVVITGSGIISFKGNKYLIKSLFTSLFIAILFISAFMAWMFSSARMMIISLLPNLIPLIVTAAFMGFSGIPIKPSTVLVFSIAFGISVDNTIHFLAKYRQELKATGLNINRSVSNAIGEAGVSMLYTSIVLFFGFGIFSLSGFGGTVALGILVSLTLLIAVTSNLILLPSLILSFGKLTGGKYFREPLLQIYNDPDDTTLEEPEEEAGRSVHRQTETFKT